MSETNPVVGDALRLVAQAHQQPNVRQLLFLGMPQIITEYPQFFTATNLEWKKALEKDEHKEIIIRSLRFLVERRRETNPVVGDALHKSLRNTNNGVLLLGEHLQGQNGVLLWANTCKGKNFENKKDALHFERKIKIRSKQRIYFKRVCSLFS
jgi:hypothetical protein